LKKIQCLNTRGSDNKGDQGRTDSEFRVEQMFREDGESMEFGWMRTVREECIRSKGNTKRGNNKIGMVKG